MRRGDAGALESAVFTDGAAAWLDRTGLAAETGAAAPARRGAETMAGEWTREVHLDDFEAAVLEASHAVPVLVDFWADWCAPCHAIAPHLAKVIESATGRIHLAKVEVDEGENMKLAGRYQLRGFPTVILFRDGAESGRFAGARTAAWIGQWLDAQLPGWGS